MPAVLSNAHCVTWPLAVDKKMPLAMLHGVTCCDVNSVGLMAMFFVQALG